MKNNQILWGIVTTILVAIFIYSLFFSRPTYKVTFDSNGGTAVVSQEIKKGEVVSQPKNPEREGFTFIGWVVDGSRYDFSTKPSGNITITAVWEEKVVYKVTFNSNGGSAVKNQSVDPSEKATKPAKPTKKGYTFVEWQLNGKKYSFSSKVTEDITLKAKWKKK